MKKRCPYCHTEMDIPEKVGEQTFYPSTIKFVGKKPQVINIRYFNMFISEMKIHLSD